DRPEQADPDEVREGMGRVFNSILGPLVAAIGLALVALSAAGAAPVVVKDALDHDVTINDASRIVSGGGPVTEILYALGLEKNIAGRESTSLYPARAATEKPSVGYMRQLSAEGMLGLRPTLVLAMAGSGTKETMAVLEAARVPLVVVPDTFSPAGIVDKIK